MRLIDAFPVEGDSRIVFVGAGGKSTAMFRLAHQAQESGHGLVIVSASTHLAIRQQRWADEHFEITTTEQIGEIPFEDLKGVVLFTGPGNHDYRTEGLPLDTLVALEAQAAEMGVPLLIEGDGSRRKPLKAPADHEPVIPPWAGEVVVCAGLRGLGKPLDEHHVHRPALFASLSGLEPGEAVTAEGVEKVLAAPEGGLRGIPPGARRSVLLNQADNPELAAAGQRIGKGLLPTYDQALVGALRKAGVDEILTVHRKVAGVVLAAGGSSRYGQPKQLLGWQGQPFVRAVAETALNSGLEHVLVVTGAQREKVEAALEGLSVEIVSNPGWEEGQASSVRSAVTVLDEKKVSAAVFFLVDQPQVGAPLVRALLNTYSETLGPVVAPMIDQQRGNPVLFDRRTFPALMAITGDKGGRQVFSKYPPVYVPWVEPRDGLDVDTEEDYRRLLDDYDSDRE